MKAQILITILIISLLFCILQSSTAQDTIAVPEKVKRFLKADPMRATMLAVALPGLGQIYNRKFWKVPFVYAGFGGAVFAITYNSTNYNKFMKAYQDFTDDIPQTDSYLELIKNADPATYDPVLHPKTYDPSAASWYTERMLRQVDYFKKYRDLSYIGFAAWYLLTVLDANVDASLFNYDISNNLNLQIEPVQVPQEGFAALGLNVSFRLFF
ncbi:MAG TPA: DUF5683 domain-containing protein [Bacteroidales bacterium]|jgi:hypothetical protein|nr:DUF5683 domain-containing protein [Bacteroidales bacterium]HOX76278.1 DUF5683 domain-containing protein [Bacteroidales bacterium]HPM86868.1 DUF5683 domain-containing protein [Bacteroidales bacterium]HQM67671.1 DUF5683 domain-containing protein [Bacteroidales bacterium]